MFNVRQLSRAVKLDEPPSVQLLLTKELSSMVSTWEEHLGFQQISEGRWRVGTFVYNWLSVDAIPEADRYSEDGELVIPDVIDGRKILGLVDGEYLETDELIARDEVEFGVKDLKLARQFCLSQGWDEITDFEYAWFLMESTVKPKKALSKYKAFKQMAIVRAGSAASMSGFSESELAVYKAQNATQIWVWGTELATECITVIAGQPTFGQVLQRISRTEGSRVEIDWNTIKGQHLSVSASIVLSCAWSFDEGGKTTSRLMGKIPDSVLLPFLEKVSLAGIQLCEWGDRLLNLIEKKGISIDDIETILPRRLASENDLLNSLKRAVVQAEKRAKKERTQQEVLAPFFHAITRLVDNYSFGKSKRYYPGAGYVIPPLGVHSLRLFLTNYVIKHKSLPQGIIEVPYDKQELGKPSAKAFTVDFDQL